MRICIKAFGLGAVVTALVPGVCAAAPFITFSESFVGNEAFSNFNYIPGGEYLLNFTSNIPVFQNSITIDNYVNVFGCTYYDSGGLMGCDEQQYDRDVTAPPSSTDLQNFSEKVDIVPLPPTLYQYYPDGHLYSFAEYTGAYSDIDIFFDNPNGQTVNFTLTLTLLPEPGVWAMLLVGIGAVGAALRERRSSRLENAASA